MLSGVEESIEKNLGMTFQDRYPEVIKEKTDARPNHDVSDFLSWNRIKYHVLCAVGLSAILGFTGPLGTYETLSTIPRLIYWTLGILGHWMLSISIYSLMLKYTDFVHSKYHHLAPFIVSTLVAIPGTFYVLFLQTYFLPGAELTDRFTLFLAIFLCVFVVTSGVYFFVEREYLTASDREKSAVPVIVLERPESPFFRRLQKGTNATLLYIQAQDHYVRAVTDKGEELILMRFRDAIEELKNVPGHQIHRSFWVAETGFEASKFEGGQYRIYTTKNERLTVGRTYVKPLKNHGWL